MTFAGDRRGVASVIFHDVWLEYSNYCLKVFSLLGSPFSDPLARKNRIFERFFPVLLGITELQASLDPVQGI